MDSLEVAVDLSRGAILTALELALPVLAAGLLIGLLVSIVQTMTHVHDQTLSFIPKILSMAAVIFLLLPWFLSVLVTYTQDVFEQIGGGFYP